MGIVQIIFAVLIALSSIVLIISVLLQEGQNKGVSAISGGGSETFFGKNKSKTKEAKLGNITKVAAIVFVVCCLGMLIFA